MMLHGVRAPCHHSTVYEPLLHNVLHGFPAAHPGEMPGFGT